MAGDRTGRARLRARNALVSSWLRRPLPVAVRRLPAVVPERHLLPVEVERQVRLLETVGAPRRGAGARA